MNKRLIKDSNNKVICGVLAGFANYFGIDIDILRVLVIFFTIGFPSLAILYLVLALTLEEN